MPSELQHRMFQDLSDKRVFEAAKQCAYRYLDSAFERRVYPSAAAIRDLERFDEPLPQDIGDALEIVGTLDEWGSPGTVSSVGGRYFGLVVGSSLPAALAARWLADCWDQNAALHKLSPVAAKLEAVCETWLRDIFGLPETSVAGFVSGTSAAILAGLAAARHRLLGNAGWDVNARGLMGAPPLRIVAGRQLHGTVEKAIAVLGLGTANIELVDVDEQGRILPDRIPQLDERTILLLQAGNVNGGSFDDFATICGRARDSGAWIHIDGAFGLWAAASPRLAHLTRGIEAAHSWSVDGHKTLNTPYDCGIILCSDGEALVAALQASGSYIPYGEERDGMLYTQEMSRRARAIELWASLKYLGRQGLDELVHGLHERTAQMAEELCGNSFEILNEIVFNQLLVSCGSDGLTERTMACIQEAGECWVGGAKWQGRSVIRISICSWATTEEDVSRSVQAFVEARDRVGAISAP